VATSTDAFGQTKTRGAQTYGYDGLGRVVTATGVAGLSYTGMGNVLAGDGAATYTRDPDDAVVGEKTGGTSVAAWTDLMRSASLLIPTVRCAPRIPTRSLSGCHRF
jgi:hypothetical protein